MFRKIFKHNQFRYLLSGSSAFVIEFGCFALVLALSGGLILANSISFIVGTIAGLLFHKFWTFSGNHQYKFTWQTVAVFIVALFNLVFTNIVIGFLVDYLGAPPYIAKIIVIALIVTWNYLLFNYFIFRQQPKK